MENNFSTIIKASLSLGHTSDALSTLLEASKQNKDIHDSISMIIFDFNDLTNQIIRGTISNDEATVRKNKINNRILSATELFTTDGKVLPKIILNKRNSSRNIIRILSIFIVFFAFLAFLATKSYEYHYMDMIFFGISGWSFIALLVVLVLNSLKSK